MCGDPGALQSHHRAASIIDVGGVSRTHQSYVSPSSLPCLICPKTIEELHLLEYKQKALEYLQSFKTCPNSLFPRKLIPFSGPYDPDGYGDTFMTHDLITDIYLEFSERTRKKESDEYIKTLTGELI
jgi:hypothetical protein